MRPYNSNSQIFLRVQVHEEEEEEDGGVLQNPSISQPWNETICLNVESLKQLFNPRGHHNAFLDGGGGGGG